MKSNQLIHQGEQLLITGNFEAAKDILTDALLKDPNNPEVYYLLGDTLCKLNRFEEAITLLRKANRLLPNHPKIIHLLGWVLFMNGETDASRMLMKKSLTMDSDNEQIYADLAVLEMKSNNLNRARHYISLGKKITPNDLILNKIEVILENMVYFSEVTDAKKKFN